MRPRLTSTKVMERTKCGERRYLLMIQNMQAHGSSRVNSEIYKKHFVCQLSGKCVQTNWEESHHAAIQWPKTHRQHNKITSLGRKKWKVLDWPSQSPELNSIEHAVHQLRNRIILSSLRLHPCMACWSNQVAWRESASFHPSPHGWCVLQGLVLGPHLFTLE